MLRFSLRTGTKLNVEIKNVPTDADFTPNPPAFVDPIIEMIHEMGMLSRDHVMIQTFWPDDLDRAAERVAELVPDRPQLRLRLRAPRTQRSLRRVLARALCRGSDCSATVRGRVRVNRPGGEVRAFPIAPRQMDLEAESWERFAVGLPARPRRAARRALRAGGTAHARIRVRAVERFGEMHRVRVRRVALRR